ncbi:YraN family protein [Flavicella marina]|uniref:YraN family protein n=1 Tax=Flavicella marina TaxID=1475951 RepID=UPI0012640322|nr:YraN family protein [Flavicella marina]
MASHNDFGKKGELLALEYLLENNYKIVEKNWRYQKAEIDIIAQKDSTLVIAEVKTRSSDYYGNPQDFVSPKKINLLVSAADAYVLRNHLDFEVRFDIIAVLKKSQTFQIEHIKDAFLYF